MKTTLPVIGILGGGQLARMMALKAHSMGVKIMILSESPNDPAALVSSHWIKGCPNNKKDLTEFLNQVDIATFESEFLDAELLSELSKKTKTKIFPEPKTMGLLQDRLSQKISFEEAGLPTSPFIKIDSFEQLEQVISEVFDNFVLKKRRFGYDGYGTFVIQDEDDLPKLKKEFKNNPDGFILEKFCPFKRELAVSAARTVKGDIKFLPLVETHQKDSRCLWVRGPVEHQAYKKIKKKIKAYLNHLNYVGIMAFELFDVDGELMVNEIAPRVHNSGHYSLDALTEDQFSLHLKTLFMDELPKVKKLSEAFAMYNLLGTGIKKARLPQFTDIAVHWYAKEVSREGRKMGHITSLGSTADKALKKLKNVIKEYKV